MLFLRGEQDGGEGGVGTVVEIGGRQNAATSTPVGTVIVQVCFLILLVIFLLY